MKNKVNKKEVVKVQVTFTKKQMEIMREYQDIFGESDAEIVRAIIMNWLALKKEGSKNEGIKN
jgi:RNA-binding protein YhbY